MSFGNPLELCLLAQICFVRLTLFSVGTCLIFVASTERKISLLRSMAIHIKRDARATYHVVRFLALFLHTASDQKLEPGKALERGYIYHS